VVYPPIRPVDYLLELAMVSESLVSRPVIMDDVWSHFVQDVVHA